ncbi:MAG: hypothetical protein EPN74_09315 [Rhodanobacter sp.]|nr:MAG: hypothetical protein EPN74_09315 [Rhodanobacter sp.]
MQEMYLSVSGMTCADCAQHVKGSLKGVAGVAVAYPHGTAYVRAESAVMVESLNAALPKKYRVATLQRQHAGTNTPTLDNFKDVKQLSCCAG